MSRLVLLVLTFTALTASAHAAGMEDRYGPAPTGLRGAPDVGPRAQRLLSWPGKEARLRAMAAPAAPAVWMPPPAYAPQSWRPEAAPADQAPLPLVYSDPPRQAPAPQRRYPTSIYEPPARYQPAPAAAAAPAAPSQPIGEQTPRRYSLVREYGEEPDRIALPAPSVLAFSPEVAATYAQHDAPAAKDGAKGDPKADVDPPSPADLDMLEQQQQDDDQREARQKARDKAQAAVGR